MPTDTPNVDPEFALHQEQLRVGTVRSATERVVLRRRITSEVKQVEVTVRREVLEVEHLPVREQGAATAAGQTPAPLVIVLSEEVPVVQLQTRPYERVTVAVDTDTVQQQLTETVGRERVELTTSLVDETPART